MLPDGEYDATITEAEEKVSKAGNQMIEATLRVYGSDGVVVEVLDWIMDALPWKTRHLCNAIGLDFDKGEIDPGDLVDQNVRVMVSAETSGRFAGRNKITDYVGPATHKKRDDDIPF